MTKKDKIKYINDVYYKFKDTENHGGRDNWWYPKNNVIAYKVKMHNFADIKTLREHLTKTQNEYYNDDFLYNHIQGEQDDTCNLLVDDIKTLYDIKDVYFAGRSWGWVEVEYYNNIDEVDEETHTDDINNYYKEAKKMEELESKVSEFIISEHKKYNNYIDTKEYYIDLIEWLQDDEEIKKDYLNKSDYYKNLANA